MNSTPELFQYCDGKNQLLYGFSLPDFSYCTPNETMIFRVQSVLNGFNLTYKYNNNPLYPIDTTTNNNLQTILSQDILLTQDN